MGAQVFLQRFGIEPMLPNGQRVSTLPTEGIRERATARRASACALRPSLLTRPPPQVDENCVSCGHRGLSFHTMQARAMHTGALQGRSLTPPSRLQLRSADEGQTVFFECLACKHKWSVHT